MGGFSNFGKINPGKNNCISFVNQIHSGMKDYFFKNDCLLDHLASKPKNYLKRAYIELDRLIQGQLKYQKNAIQFYYSHHLFKDEVANFKKIISYLQKHFKILSYSEAINKIECGDIDANYICFSFDDGIRNCLRIAEYFHEHGISAMFFVNPEVVNEAHNAAYIKRHCHEKLHLKELDFMDWEDIAYLQKMGHEIGCHTMAHERLSEVAKNQFSEVIGAAKTEIEKRTGSIKHFAWTYGLLKDISPEAFDFTVRCGFTSIASAIRGQHFEQLDLKKNYLLRDLIIFKEPLTYVPFFYSKANRSLQKKSFI